MNYQINQVKLDVKISEVFEVENGLRAIGRSLRAHSLEVSLFFRTPKFKSNDFAVNGVYTIEGYLKSETSFLGEVVSCVDLVVESITPIVGKYDKSKCVNTVSLTGIYRGQKLSPANEGSSRTSIVNVEPISSSLNMDDLIVVAWNSVIDVLDGIAEGSNIHLTSFLMPSTSKFREGLCVLSIMTMTHLK